MKKGMMFFITLAVFLSLGLVSAACKLTPQLINQDPYPAIPGDYVKLVFQVTGIENPDCNQIIFKLVPDYPISFDPGVSSEIITQGGTYTGNYNSYVMVPYTVRVDPNAIDGNSSITLRYSASGSSNSVDTKFNLNVQDVKSDFDVFIKNYDFTTDSLTLEILNIGKKDVEALTAELNREQPNATIKGSNVNIIGSLSSNDYTTTDFEVSPNAGNINMIIFYNDVTGVRRSLNKTVYFDPSAFKDRKTSTGSGSPLGIIITILVIAGIAAYIIYRRKKKNRKKKLLRE
jgi:LPXTG-motif cell wall-anchored protein